MVCCVPSLRGGRVNYVPTALADVPGCTVRYLCEVYDTEEFSGQLFGSVVAANQELAIKPVNSATDVCITCGQHAALFGSTYAAGIPPDGLPANVATPVFDPTGNWLAMLVADPVLDKQMGLHLYERQWAPATA
jgi:hypothetical protein